MPTGEHRITSQFNGKQVVNYAYTDSQKNIMTSSMQDAGHTEIKSEYKSYIKPEKNENQT